jgi:hypothetical protein
MAPNLVADAIAEAGAQQAGDLMQAGTTVLRLYLFMKVHAMAPLLRLMRNRLET